jgi:hypothetical protein
VLYTGARAMAVLAFPWSTPALKGVGVGAMPVSLYPVPIVHRTGHPGLPNTRSVRSLCMTLPTGRMEQLSALFEALKASCCLMVAYNIHHQREINALQWGTRGWGGREAAGLQPPNSKLKKKKKYFVDTVIANVALDLPLSRNRLVTGT